MRHNLSLKEAVTHGTPKNPIRALHFTAGEGTSYPERFFVGRHWHDYVEILRIVKGDYLLELGLENYMLHEGDICIVNSGELHQITGQDPSAVHDAVLFDPQILDFSYADEWEEACIAPFLKRSLILRSILHPEDAAYPVLWPLIADLAGLALSQRNGWYIQCKLLLLRLLALSGSQGYLLPAKEALPASDVRKIERYKSIISYIEKHYQEPVTLERLADTVPCNSQYLCRCFKDVAGVTPIQYLISCRLEHARRLLAHTALSVTEVAFECGFENISYFIRKFKDAQKCTPGEYRKLMQGTGRSLPSSETYNT